MSEPIKITLYGENGEEIKTYSRSHISWEFFKRSREAGIPKDGSLSAENIKIIQEFVCDFYDNQFTIEDLIKGSDVGEVLRVATKVAFRVLQIMKEQGIALPNVQTAAK